MHRRHFMKLGTAAGLALVTPVSKHAIAGEELRQFNGPFWITINLAGAWDSTLFCDPKGDVTDNTGNGPVNRFNRDDIVNLNVNGQQVALAPGTHPATGAYDHITPANGGNPVHILQYLSDLGVTILNGVDAGLTNHQSGEQLAMSGSTASRFPTLAALAAYHAIYSYIP